VLTLLAQSRQFLALLLELLLDLLEKVCSGEEGKKRRTRR
jgi:hypothetical protein